MGKGRGPGNLKGEREKECGGTVTRGLFSGSPSRAYPGPREWFHPTAVRQFLDKENNKTKVGFDLVSLFGPS